jgi:RNA polymerase sigma factor for flagellar operon FliA
MFARHAAPKTPSVEFIRDMLPVVKRVAASFAVRLPPSTSINDLVSAGFLALIELQQRHEALPLEELERLAVPRLRGAMLDELRRADPLSRRVRQRARQAARFAESFETRHGRRPSDGEVAESLGVSIAATACATALALGAAPVAQHPDLIAELPDRSAPDPEGEAQRGERFARVRAAVEHLRVRDREIVELYFSDEMTLRQIGERFGVTEARISQLLSGAVKQLRTHCASMPPPAA